MFSFFNPRPYDCAYDICLFILVQMVWSTAWAASSSRLQCSLPDERRASAEEVGASAADAPFAKPSHRSACPVGGGPPTPKPALTPLADHALEDLVQKLFKALSGLR